MSGFGYSKKKLFIPGHKNGGYESGTYIYWKGLKQKCNARGSKFKMSYSWNDFNNFLMSVGVRPYKARLLMVDEEKGFIPGNCKWSEGKEKENLKYGSAEGRIMVKYGTPPLRPPRGIQYVK